MLLHKYFEHVLNNWQFVICLSIIFLVACIYFKRCYIVWLHYLGSYCKIPLHSFATLNHPQLFCFLKCGHCIYLNSEYNPGKPDLISLSVINILGGALLVCFSNCIIQFHFMALVAFLHLNDDMVHYYIIPSIETLVAGLFMLGSSLATTRLLVTTILRGALFFILCLLSGAVVFRLC
jgi:hypothetical protein